MTVTTFTIAKQVLQEPIEYDLIITGDDKGNAGGAYDITFTFTRGGVSQGTLSNLNVPNALALAIAAFFKTGAATNVYIPVASISTTPTSYSGAGLVGQSVTPVVVFVPEDATQKSMSWVSSNPAVATVDAHFGKITAVGIGTCTITGTSMDNPTAKVIITVAPTS